jgi:IS4 transposase
VQPETLEAADYVFVFTTLTETYLASVVMELYRARWQIELAFKRLKSLVQLGHLKKHDQIASRAWLQGKLLVAFLVDALLVTAERISPWGYANWQSESQPMFVARDFIHA